LAFGGTPYQRPAEEPEQLREFTLLPDPRQANSLPFATTEFASAPEGAQISPLYLLEDGENSAWLQTSFSLTGEGADQQSTIVVALGNMAGDGGLIGKRAGGSDSNSSS
jgi:hypothetical protein